jgi:two-component system, cell cycle response regulator DivK
LEVVVGRKRSEPDTPYVVAGDLKAKVAALATRAEPTRLALSRKAPLVLLVDDLADQRQIYQEYLEYGGFTVELASSGPEGIAKAIDLEPDIIVMDLSMPGIDGFEATRVLKAVSLTRHIPVVALTAHGPYLPREWAVDAGCDDYLNKPLLPHDLAERILGLLKTRGS